MALTSQGFACSEDEPFAQLLMTAHDITKMNAVSMTTDIAKFCQVNGVRDAEGSIFMQLGNPSRLNDDELLITSAAWANSLVASHDYRTATFLNSFFHTEKQKLHLSALEEQIEFTKISDKLNSNSGQIFDSDKREISQLIDKNMHKDADQASWFSIAPVKSILGCVDLKLNPLDHISCVKNLNQIQKIAKPVEGVTLLPVWREAINNPIYMKVFKSVAIKVMDLIKNDKVPTSRLFDDLKSEFLKTTKDAKTADQMAWNTMGILSSGGANAYLRPWMIGHSLPEMSELLNILSNGAMLLDRKAATKGFLYTFPKEVNNICDYGKNYHFWMTAYLAHQAVEGTTTITGAAAAAFSADKGYQYLKDGSGRDPTLPFTSSSLSTYNNNIRLDVTMSAAGAWYGATSVSGGKALNQDQVNGGFRLTFEGVQAVPLRTPEEMKGFSGSLWQSATLYSDWKKIINPDASFFYFKTQIGQ